MKLHRMKFLTQSLQLVLCKGIDLQNVGKFRFYYHRIVLVARRIIIIHVMHMIGILKKSAKFSLSCIDKWISPTKKQVPLLFYPSKGVVQPEPLGLVLIFSSFKARLLPLHIDNCLGNARMARSVMCAAS
ncbi:hypothetical protein POM88_007485 [Heracleum sosnowskyi]|uniref:Uncharacterized protein n=1 Tax=Heracleum sosnowskyi TaxID=360622 RepID=A0AAD8N6A2_9APIA|nr:hypothetical protein POM88_007485 [Heracleum sosnowskyi]